MKNLKKSLLCPKKSQKVTWEPDAVRLQHKIEHGHRPRQQGGTQMRYVCSIRSNMCHMVEAAGWDPDAVHFRNWCLDVAKVFKKRGLDPVPF